MPRLFGTSGIRGVYNEDLDPQKVLSISLAIGSYYGAGAKALVGYDCRLSSNAITSIVAGGLISTGVSVDICGYITTPAFQKYMASTDEYDFGLIITASHNPPKYNGIKLIGKDGLEEYVDVEDRIQNIFETESYSLANWDKLGAVNYIGNTNIINTYVKSLISNLDGNFINKRFRIVFDFTNCVSVFTIKELVNSLENVDGIFLNEDLDGRFPNRPSEPKPENLNLLMEKVVEEGADFGVGFDGDGDRAIIVDDEGVAWWGDYLGTVISKYLLETRGLKGIATPVTSSSVVDIVLGGMGIKVYRTKVGAKHIVKKMVEEKLLLGFEENGGIIYAPHVLTRDGGISTILTINIITHFEDSLSSIMRELPLLYQIKDKLYLSNREVIPELMSAIQEEYRDKCMYMDLTDGVKIYFSKDRWVLIRPSGTEPIIRVFAEGPTKDDAKLLVDTFKRKLETYLETM